MLAWSPEGTEARRPGITLNPFWKAVFDFLIVWFVLVAAAYTCHRAFFLSGDQRECFETALLPPNALDTGSILSYCRIWILVLCV